MKKGLLLIVVFLIISCISQKGTIEINDYIVLDDGIEILGKGEGLSAFVFENDPSKIPFQQFLGDKYNIGNYRDMSYWVTIGVNRYKVFLYENSEVEKYFDTSQFLITTIETEPNIKGTTAKLIALSVINEYNEDCLAEESLFKNIAVTYLKGLKDEYLKN